VQEQTERLESGFDWSMLASSVLLMILLMLPMTAPTMLQLLIARTHKLGE
jgi:hypothetical protein